MQQCRAEHVELILTTVEFAILKDILQSAKTMTDTEESFRSEFLRQYKEIYSISQPRQPQS